MSLYTISNEFSSQKKLADEDVEQYNPYEHREVKKPVSTKGSYMHLLKGSLGSGIFALPLAFSYAGLGLGLVGILFIGILYAHCVYILVDTSHNLCLKTKVPKLNFPETAEKAFENGPSWLKRKAPIARAYIEYSLLMGAFSGSVYIVFIASTFHDIGNFFLQMDLDVRVYILLTAIPVLMISWIRYLKFLVPLSVLANIFVIITILITVFYMFREPLQLSDKVLITDTYGRWPKFFSITIYAFGGIATVLPLENCMKKPHKFLGCHGVLNSAMIPLIFLYAFMGFFGFVRYGNSIKCSITFNLPNNEAISLIAQSLVALSALFTIGLVFYIIMDIFWKKIELRVPKDQHKIAQVAIRIGLGVVMTALALAIPNLSVFIGLIGAVLYSSQSFLAPAVIEMVYLYEEGYGKFKWRLIKNILISLFAIFTLITGLYVSILDVMKIYDIHKVKLCENKNYV